MTLDNGYIPVQHFEKFKKMIDDNLGTEYEFDEPRSNDLYVSGWVEAETKSEVAAYEVAFELCKGINFKDSDDLILYRDELATKSNTFLKHNNVLFDVNKLAFAGVPEDDLILIFSNGQYIRVKGREESLLILDMIKNIIGTSIVIDQRNYLFRAEFLIHVRKLQSSEFRPKCNEMYLTFKHGNYQSIDIDKDSYDDISNEFLDILNSVIKRGTHG